MFATVAGGLSVPWKPNSSICLPFNIELSHNMLDEGKWLRKNIPNWALSIEDSILSITMIRKDMILILNS